MKNKIIYLLIILSQLFCSCTEDRFIEAEPQIVVEGWIDAGGYPIVMLSQIIPVSDKEITQSELKDYIINWGKVTISDGEKEVVLTGRKSDEYFPPYIYTTNKIRGEEGKTYYLTAEYKDFYAKAQTTIPPKAEIKDIVTRKENNRYYINAVIDDNPEEKNYYKFFVRVIGRDSCYLSSNFAIINDKDYTFPCSIPLEIGNSALYDDNNKLYTVSEKDALLIKVAQIDSAAYNLWDDYKNIAELGQNRFFSYTNSIRSNISGGLGYWVGYGATEYLCKPNDHENPVKLEK